MTTKISFFGLTKIKNGEEVSLQRLLQVSNKYKTLKGSNRSIPCRRFHFAINLDPGVMPITPMN
jgi:hypothetical protein